MKNNYLIRIIPILVIPLFLIIFSCSNTKAGIDKEIKNVLVNYICDLILSEENLYYKNSFRGNSPIKSEIKHIDKKTINIEFVSKFDNNQIIILSTYYVLNDQYKSIMLFDLRNNRISLLKSEIMKYGEEHYFIEEYIHKKNIINNYEFNGP